MCTVKKRERKICRLRNKGISHYSTFDNQFAYVNDSITQLSFCI